MLLELNKFFGVLVTEVKFFVAISGIKKTPQFHYPWGISSSLLEFEEKERKFVTTVDIVFVAFKILSLKNRSNSHWMEKYVLRKGIR